MQRRTFVKSALAGTAGAGLLNGGIDTAGAQAGTPNPDCTLDEIEILTDDREVSHVYGAEDVYALGYGNGYVQARDRLFEMDVLRHVGFGNSAEVLGSSQIPSDVQVKRDLYSREKLQAQFEKASPEAKQMIRGYSAGINRKMTELAATGDLPGEFGAIGHAPEPWEPVDTMAVVAYLIGIFGVAGGSELGNAKDFAKLRETLGSERAAYDAYEDFNWLRTRDSHYTSIDESDKVVEGGEGVIPYEEVPDEQLARADAAPGAEIWGIEADVQLSEAVLNGERTGQGIMEGFKWGSNALVVDGEHTETGQPMMFGGPQLGHFKPPAIYEVGLHGAGYDVVGFGVPGAPGVLIGRTPDFAWSVTSAREDMVDTIAVELDPDDKHRYRWKGEWHEMDCRTVTHNGSPVGDAIGGGDPRVVEQEVCRITEEGDEMTVIARNAEANVAWVQRTTVRDKLLTGAFEWVTLGRRDDRDGFEEALSDFSFSFNFLYADDEDIAYYHLADVPDREPGPDFRLPRTDTGHEWLDGLVGLDLGTVVRNPSKGYVANWNNGPAKGWRAGDMPQNWGSIHRAEVLDRFVRKRLDDTGDSLALDDVRAILRSAATHDSVAFGPVPHIIEAARASSDPQLNAMADELEAWTETGYAWRDEDDDGRYDDPGHAIYDETMHELLARTFGDELGDRVRSLDFEPPVTRHAADHGRADKMVTLVDALEGTTNRNWFDDVETAGDETRGEVLRDALEAAADTLTEQFGSPLPSQWLLEEHTSKFMPIGAAKQNEIEMVNRGSWNQVVALDQPGLENSRGIIPPSNSGYISPEELATLQATGTEPDRLTDQLGRYRSFEYRPLPSTRAGVEAVTTTSQTLTIRDPNAGEDGPDEPVGSSENPPNDPDCDGKFEDVNGDGSFDIVDVQALFANRDGETVQNNPSAFNFDASNGEVDVVDVQALFVEEQGN